jgi:phosphate:Na+ symporter
MPRDVADALTHTLRSTRYLEEVARLAPSVQGLTAAAAAAELRAALAPAQAAAAAALQATATQAGAALADFERAYQHSKASVLAAMVGRKIEVEPADAVLDDLSRLRRLVQQWCKATAALAAEGSTSTSARDDFEEAE